MKRVYIIIICLLLSSCVSYRVSSQRDITIIIESDFDLNVVKNTQIELFGCKKQYENCDSLEVIRPTALGPYHVNVPKYSFYQLETTSVNCLSGGIRTTVINVFSSSTKVYTTKLGKYCGTRTTIKSNKPGSYNGTNENWGRTIQ